MSGYKVLAAAGGRQALELFAREPVDAVLLDYCMPDMNGDAVAEEIRRLNPSVPLVLLSAYPSLPERVLQVVDKVIAKPQHPQVLLNLLASLFAEIATCPPDQSAA